MRGSDDASGGGGAEGGWVPSSRAIRGVGSAAETHQLHVVLGEVVSPVLPADGELAGHAGGSSGVDDARSKLTSRRGSIRFCLFLSQVSRKRCPPTDRAGSCARNPSQPPSPMHAISSRGKHRKREETARGAARRRIPPRARRPRRISRVDSSSPRRLGAPSPTRAGRLPGLEASSAVFLGVSRVLAPRLSRQKQQRVRRVRLVDHVRASPEHRALPSFVRRHGAR